MDALIRNFEKSGVSEMDFDQSVNTTLLDSMAHAQRNFGRALDNDPEDAAIHWKKCRNYK